MVKKPSSSRKLSVYSNLAHKHRTKKDAHARKKAEYLATLPKHPVKRLLARMHPTRVAGFWLSKKGGMMLLKVAGVSALLGVLMVGGLFAYYRKDLDQIRPGELAKRVQTTVTKYYDRRGPAGGPEALLWEDKGDSNYKLVVDSKDINNYMKHATIAIEDRDFYKHNGISPTGLVRAAVNNAQGGATQGGSTLTQQLVKQVFFADEAQKRGLNGVPRKIKEVILAIEVERMYDKDQILSLYLNESPYGGRRNGVQSAAQTYFGKNAKDLTLAEASLLAAVPQNPAVYNPYNTAGHPGLTTRQHKVLDNMVELGYITKSEADEAKKVAVLDTIKPESSQYKDIKAPHFVQMVRSQLEKELGKATVGRGGLTVTTTLDLGIQQKLEQSIKDHFDESKYASWQQKPSDYGYTNAAGTVEDTKTGQILALMGSRDWEAEGIGQDNAATAFIQPGSSIKPLVFAELFKQKEKGQNYGSGSILADDNSADVRRAYGVQLNNADKRYKGALTIRQGLAQSRNVPAVKAMMISGGENYDPTPTLQTIRDMGDTYYCTQGTEVQTGLSSAIGGCGTRQVDHVNAFATLARMGTYKPHTSILEVKNSQGNTLKKWKDQSKQVLDPQIAYILSDILNDDNARRPLIGSITKGFSYGNTGIRTATKTGTSDLDGKPKDLWVMTYSPVISMGVWLGNSDTRALNSGNSTLPGPIVDEVMRYAHLEVYQKQNKWKPGDWFAEPEGIQKIRNELYPSWFNRNNLPSNAKMTFDKVSKKLATDCTPEGARIEVDVLRTTDPATKKTTNVAMNGYDASGQDNVHKCDDAKPSVSSISMDNIGPDSYRVTVSVAQGTHPLSSLEIRLNGAAINSQQVSGSGDYSATFSVSGGDAQNISAVVTDSAFYSAEASQEFKPGGGG